MHQILRKALVVSLAAALGVGTMVASSAMAAGSGQGTPLTTKTQAMDGDLKVAQGSTLSVGYDFTMPGNHPLATVGFMGTTVTFQATCASGTPGSQTIMVEPADQSYTDPANSSAWYPSGDQNNGSTYQGSVALGSTTLPKFCDQGALVRLQQGGTFNTNVSSTDTQDKVNLRWHYKDGTGGGWSGTYSVVPSVATVCTVTNTTTNLIYPSLQGAQDAAGNGDTLTVQNTCTGPTTISQDNLTIAGVDGTSPTLDGNQAGTVLSFDPNLTFTVNNLTIQNGHGINGGGVAIHDNSTFAFNHDTVIHNTADRTGGGFYTDDVSAGTITNTTVTGNMAAVGGLGVDSVNTDMTFVSSTVTLNLPIRQDLNTPDLQDANYANPVITYYNSHGSLTVLSSTVSTVGMYGATAIAYDAASVFVVEVSVSWGAATPTCAKDQQSGLGYPTLQLAQDSAADGDNLQVTGTCHGQTIFTHSVNVTGENVAVHGVLDGGGTVTPVIVNHLVTVTMTNMTITNGAGTDGGGVNNDGILNLENTTVSNNSATTGGGIYNTGSMQIVATLITGNAAVVGGGIYMPGASVDLQGSVITGNNAADVGGGIFWDSMGTLTIDGASSVTGNGGGDIF